MSAFSFPLARPGAAAARHVPPASRCERSDGSRRPAHARATRSHAASVVPVPVPRSRSVAPPAAAAPRRAAAPETLPSAVCRRLPGLASSRRPITPRGRLAARLRAPPAPPDHPFPRPPAPCRRVQAIFKSPSITRPSRSTAMVRRWRRPSRRQGQGSQACPPGARATEPAQPAAGSGVKLGMGRRAAPRAPGAGRPWAEQTMLGMGLQAQQAAAPKPALDLDDGRRIDGHHPGPERDPRSSQWSLQGDYR